MQQQLEPEEQAIDATKHAPTAPPRDKVKKPNGPVTCTTATEAKGPDATALTGIGENEPATTPSTSAEENITGTVIEKKHRTVCTHRHPQAHLAPDYEIETTRSNYSERQQGISESETESADGSDNFKPEADWIQCVGQIGSLITQMTLMKQNSEKRIVASPETLLLDAKEAA